MIWAVLPLKDFIFAKQRLSKVFSGPQRQAFFRAMVEDVLTVLSGLAEIDQILIVSDDETAKQLAKHFNIRVIPENREYGPGLNGAVRHAAAYVAEQGADTMLVIHGDIPLVNRKELLKFVAFDSAAAQMKARLSIVPDREGQGSNVMMCTPPDVIDFHYGPGSCQKHQQTAADAGVHCGLVNLPGLGLDIDTAEDLKALVADLPNYADGQYTTDFLKNNAIDLGEAGLDTQVGVDLAADSKL